MPASASSKVKPATTKLNIVMGLSTPPEADRASRLVFITRGISERQVRDLLASMRALASGSS